MAQYTKKKISSFGRKLSEKIRSKLKTRRRTSSTKKRTSSPKRKNSSSSRTTTPKSNRIKNMFGRSKSNLMGPPTPGSTTTTTPQLKPITTPNSTTPGLVLLSQRSPRVQSLETPFPQTSNPENVRITPTGPGGMGPNINCFKNKTEEDCNSIEDCKWDQERKLCNLKPPELNLNSN
jgi:hypothetical protein